MTFTLEPQIGVPFPPYTQYTDLRVRAEAVCNTAQLLSEFGVDMTPSDYDREVADTLVRSYAKDPEHASKTVTNPRAAALRPASIVLAHQILTEFGHRVAESSAEIRNLVTNKLLLESEHSDARVRLKAIELLGKIEDVGLFTQKSEVTITHQTTGELRLQLKEKLHKLIRPEEDIEEAFLIEEDNNER